MKYADLHIHTTASDGILEPENIVMWANEKNLATIGITDHDTTAGLDTAIAKGKKIGVDIIPGIELGTYVDEHEVHILGYYIDYDRRWFQAELESLKTWRNSRAYELIENLNAIYAIEVSAEHVKKIAGDAAISRPHIGRALVEMGLAKDLSDAFDRYIGNTCPAYVPRRTLSPKKGIGLIKESGGIPILAHPGLIADKSIIAHIIDLGIEGIEVFHPSHMQEEERIFFKLCQQRRLLVTGGSDFHDEFVGNSPALGQKKLHYSHVEKLKARAENHKNFIDK